MRSTPTDLLRRAAIDLLREGGIRQQLALAAVREGVDGPRHGREV